MAGVVVDANLLVLLAVGTARAEDILTHKRLGGFTASHFFLLRSFLRPFDKVVVTPHTLTEAANLLSQTRQPGRSRGLNALRGWTRDFIEVYDPAALIVEDEEFLLLGLADAAQLIAAKAGHTLLTTDWNLYGAASKRRLEAIHFRHLPMPD